MTLFITPLSLADHSSEMVSLDPDTQQRCVQAGNLEPDNLTDADKAVYLKAASDNSLYQIWEVAEKISRNIQYPQQQKSHLTLQLVCQGGFAPAEVKYAVLDVYDHWQHQRPFEFDLCQYITSGVGTAFCSNRFAGEQQLARKKRQDAAISHLPPSQQKAIKNAIQMANDFFEHKARYEELHSGSSYAAFRIESVSLQNDKYLSQIIDTLAGTAPEDIPALEEANLTMEQTYNSLTHQLKGEPIEDFNLEITAEDIKSVQRAWQTYRDQTAALLTSLNPNLTQQDWLGILAAERSRQLSELQAYLDLSGH
ncbi:hypothetical protein [Photobacterium galatheae]|nr:hypothetical protein [Photobacterium galatheae]MCM0150133.1 hypothetical protein [Photobacterium galatheae]